MTDYVKKSFIKHIPLEINQQVVKNIIQMVIEYGIRDDHALALNTPLLKTKMLYFTTADQSSLFEIFGYNKRLVTNIIRDIPSVEKDRIVTSDAYNLFVLWVIHSLMKFKDPLKDKEKCMFSLLNILQYKFFSSFVNNKYPYTPNEDIMRFTIENLTNKFDIVKYGTWRKVIFHRSEDVMEKSSIHYKSLLKFDDDKKIFYVLSDIQTKIRSQIVKINRLFYKNKDVSNVIQSYSPMKDIDGMKILKDIRGTTDTVNFNLQVQITNKKLFINDSYIKMMNSLYKTVKITAIRSFLEYICDLAKEQSQSEGLIKVIDEKDFVFYNDVSLLSYKIIRVMYEYCFNNNINIKSKLAIFQTSKKLIGSSRIQNKDIINIRKSIERHVLNSNISNREATISSLIVIYGLYVTMKSFEFI